MASSIEELKEEEVEVHTDEATTAVGDSPVYTLDKWRFPGVVGLVILNIVAGLNWPWFGSISAETARDFQISTTQVNWLGNIVSLVFLPGSLAMPFLCKRYGIRGCCFMGGAMLIFAAWVRFAGTAKHLSPRGAYALLCLGQIFAGAAQPAFQVLGPRFSQAWFDFNGRTTATMIISVANPVGSALGQLLPSLLGSTRSSILILAIISTAVFPITFLIYSQPLNPPTFSGAVPSPPTLSTVRSLLNRPRNGDKPLSLRTRTDFAIITVGFGCFVAAANGFSLLTAQIFGPYGYSPTESGLFGATLILAGLVAAIVTAPLFDRVFTRHITITIKVATQLLGLSWLSLIFAVRPDNIGGLFAVMAIVGILSLTLLPLTLELACELSGDAETSSAIMWFLANLMGVVFVLVEDALTASADASPPFNLRKALIFVAVVVCTAATSVLCLRGLTDSRRSLDAAKQREEALARTGVILSDIDKS